MPWSGVGTVVNRAAPKSVVDAVQEAETHRMTAPPCSEHQTCWPCACGAHMPTQNALHRHRVRVAADAAWTAAYPAALRDAADRLPEHTEGTNGEGTAAWPERHREVYSLAIEEAQGALRRWADESEDGTP